MKHRFYITDLNAGGILGTDDPETARAYAASEDNFVVDAELGEWLTSDQSAQPVEEAHL